MGRQARVHPNLARLFHLGHPFERQRCAGELNRGDGHRWGHRRLRQDGDPEYNGVPSGVTVSFDPSSDTPEFRSTMTIGVDESVTPGTYQITIKGTGADGKERTASYSLTVTEAGLLPIKDSRPNPKRYGPNRWGNDQR